MNTELSTVFIIEGGCDACEFLGTTLETAGFGTRIYASGEEFLDSFDPEQQPHGQRCCVLIDVLLPGMTGLELQASLKAIKSTCRVFSSLAKEISFSVFRR